MLHLSAIAGEARDQRSIERLHELACRNQTSYPVTARAAAFNRGLRRGTPVPQAYAPHALLDFVTRRGSATAAFVFEPVG